MPGPFAPRGRCTSLQRRVGKSGGGRRGSYSGAAPPTPPTAQCPHLLSGPFQPEAPTSHLALAPLYGPSLPGWMTSPRGLSEPRWSALKLGVGLPTFGAWLTALSATLSTAWPHAMGIYLGQWVAMTRWRGAPGIRWVEATGAAQYPAVPPLPPSESDLAPNVHSAEGGETQARV